MNSVVTSRSIDMCSSRASGKRSTRLSRLGLSGRGLGLDDNARAYTMMLWQHFHSTSDPEFQYLWPTWPM